MNKRHEFLINQKNRTSLNKRGLSIFEVMIAILIVGITVTSILALQGTLSRAVFTAHAFVDRIAFIKSFFVEADRDKLYEDDEPHKKVIETPQLTMTYKVTKPTGKGLKTFKHIQVEQIDAEWPTVFGKRQETMGVLRFMPKPERKK